MRTYVRIDRVPEYKQKGWKEAKADLKADFGLNNANVNHNQGDLVCMEKDEPVKVAEAIKEKAKKLFKK